MLVTTSIVMPPSLFERTQRLGVNRSAICRAALEKEVERLEREEGAEASKAPAPTPAHEEQANEPITSEG